MVCFNPEILQNSTDVVSCLDFNLVVKVVISVSQGSSLAVVKASNGLIASNKKYLYHIFQKNEPIIWFQSN